VRDIIHKTPYKQVHYCDKNKLITWLKDLVKSQDGGQAIFDSSKKEILDLLSQQANSEDCIRKEILELICKIKILKN
jgi:hypothetical protein